MRRHRTWAGLLLVALVALVGEAACASGQAGFRVGREPQGAAQVAYVQRVLASCAGDEACAVAKLIGIGMSEREARRAVLDAVVAGGRER
jgi:hypothetical protein